MSEHNFFYHPRASVTNAELPVLRVPALWCEKLVILDPVGASWNTVGTDHIARDAVRQLSIEQSERCHDISHRRTIEVGFNFTDWIDMFSIAGGARGVDQSRKGRAWRLPTGIGQDKSANGHRKKTGN